MVLDYLEKSSNYRFIVKGKYNENNGCLKIVKVAINKKAAFLITK